MYPLIDLQGVTKTYPSGVCALDGVDLHIEKGEFVFVVGHSGAGKSTLIKTLLREEVPTEGEVTVNGRDLIHMKQREIPYFRRTIGVVFQDFRLIPTMTVFDNVAFALQVTGVPRRFIRRRVPYILNLLGLDDKYKHYPAELSGGSGPNPPRIVGTPTSELALKGEISIKLTPEKSSVSLLGSAASSSHSSFRIASFAA